MSQPTLDIKRIIADIKEVIEKWEEMGSIFFRCVNSPTIQQQDENDFRKKLDELNAVYPRIANFVNRNLHSVYHDPVTGLVIRDYNPITEILYGTTSLRHIMYGPPPSIGLRDELEIARFEKDWHRCRSLLLSMRGMAEATLRDIGKVTLTEYLSLKELEKKFEKLKSIDDFCSLVEEIDFLRLSGNWSLGTIALQIQEVATIKVAEHLRIPLDKASVESILATKLREVEFGFNKQYEALAKRLKESRNVELPNMTTRLRGMRVDILHKGYNPKKEEVDAIVEFTKGFLARLKTLY